jgi:exonuclease SbcD
VRLLHTADWHLGRTIRGRSRHAEFEAVLAEVLDIARAERVEAMLVCGDIFDSATPAPEFDRLLNEALRECVGLGIQVVLLAGNHDNPRRLEALGRLSDLLGVYVQSTVQAPDEGGVITITGAEDTARIAAIPWIREGHIIDAATLFMTEHDARIQAYADQAASVLRALCRDFTPDTVNILAGHVFVDGSQLAALDGSERLLHVGQAYGVNPAALPTTPQYMALGHIHQPQELRSTPVPAAYSGSLLQLDFGERGQQKVVRIIEAVPGRPVEQRPITITRGRPLLEVRGNLMEVAAAAEASPGAHLRVVLDVDRPEPGMAQRVRDLVPGAVDVRLQYEKLEAEKGDDERVLGKLAPQDLVARYYRAQHGVEPTPELLALFSELFAAETRVDLAVSA